jgi:uncharacterized coiled-coil DUF342 family protein
LSLGGLELPNDNGKNTDEKGSHVEELQNKVEALRNACDAYRQNTTLLICEINGMRKERDTQRSEASCASPELLASKSEQDVLKFDLDKTQRLILWP